MRRIPSHVRTPTHLDQIQPQQMQPLQDALQRRLIDDPTGSTVSVGCTTALTPSNSINSSAGIRPRTRIWYTLAVTGPPLSAAETPG